MAIWVFVDRKGETVGIEPVTLSIMKHRLNTLSIIIIIIIIITVAVQQKA